MRTKAKEIETQLSRTAFVTDRTLEFFSESELTMQIGYGKPLWPLVLVKELIDNALDSCEATGVVPEIVVRLEADSIAVSDNGPGLKQSIIETSLDYSRRISDKKHYVAPTRGQLGNALKCLWAAACVATGKKSVAEVAACGLHHCIEVDIDRLAQKPRIKHSTTAKPTVKNGTLIKVFWPEVASLDAHEDHAEFYQAGSVRECLPELVRDFAALNPHATFALTVCGKSSTFKARDRAWRKWRTSDPTSAHWYRTEDLRELIAAYVRSEKRLTVRDFVAEFDGLTGTQYRKRVLEEAGLTDACLADLVTSGDVDIVRVGRLLEAMKRNSRPPKPQRLGILGKDNLQSVLMALGVDLEGFEYGKAAAVGDDCLPYVIEVGFGVSRDHKERRKLIIGLNNSPVFRVTSEHLSNALSNCHVQCFDPIVLLIHQASPRFVFLGHGKGSVA